MLSPYNVLKDESNHSPWYIVCGRRRGYKSDARENKTKPPLEGSQTSSANLQSLRETSSMGGQTTETWWNKGPT